MRHFTFIGEVNRLFSICISLLRPVTAGRRVEMAMAEMLTHFGLAELKLLEVLNFTPVPFTSEREASVSPCWLLSVQHSCDVLEHPLWLGAHIFSRPDILFQTMGLTGWAWASEYWLGKEERAYRSNTGGHCLRQPVYGQDPHFSIKLTQ